MFVVTFDLCDISSASLVAKKLVVYKSGELTDRRDVGGPGHGATAVCVCVCGLLTWRRLLLKNEAKAINDHDDDDDDDDDDGDD